MKIEVLGTGCSKCKEQFEIVKLALAQKGKFAQLEKVEDMMKILEYGVMSTPALVIDGVVKTSGKVVSLEDVLNLLD